MSYMICEKCCKHYPLEEGKSSFNFERCECGGKLRYSSSIKEDSQVKTVKTSSKIKFTGIFIGFIFLFISLTLSVVALFGINPNLNALNISSKVLTIFTIITVILTVSSGSISSYISGSRRYWDGAVNGGLVGVILGLILGIIGGVIVLITAILVLGSLSMLGGLFSSFLRKIVNSNTNN